MVHKDQDVHLVVKTIAPATPHYWSIAFERPSGFMYDAGDWIDIDFQDPAIYGGKTYSLSSSPSEPDMQITFREGLSPLKMALRNVKTDDKVTVTQYGNDYGFGLRANKSSILIAGGVGIAPFRSMIKEMYDQASKADVQLIYLNQTDDYLFKDELEMWCAQLGGLSIHWIATKDINRKKREKLLKSIITNTNQQFYIAGPPGMVETTERLLDQIGVSERDIKTDVFGGY